MAPDYDLPLCDFVAPLDRRAEGGQGSTDVGDVSWATPTVQERTTSAASGLPAISVMPSATRRRGC
jgi:aminobenzoyl-glutamate utilization protein B